MGQEARGDRRATELCRPWEGVIVVTILEYLRSWPCPQHFTYIISLDAHNRCKGGILPEF